MKVPAIKSIYHILKFTTFNLKLKVILKELRVSINMIIVWMQRML